MAYNDPTQQITPEERERNLNRSLDQVWADADESRMDKALETLQERLARKERAAKDDAASLPEESATS